MYVWTGTVLFALFLSFFFRKTKKAAQDCESLSFQKSLIYQKNSKNDTRVET